MTVKSNKWDELIIKAILSNNEFGILEIRNLKPIKSIIFDQSKYSEITSLIDKKDWKGINSIEDENKSGFREYLDIVKFSNQDDQTYIATVYDSDELWQDPEIKDIFLSN